MGAGTLTAPAGHPAATTEAGFLLRGLTRSFGSREVLKGIDLAVHPGQFVALLGRSGSGKSTMLRALAGLDTQAGGDIFVPERRGLDDVLRDGVPLPDALVQPIAGAVRSRLESVPERRVPSPSHAPVLVQAGSLGSWDEEAAG